MGGEPEPPMRKAPRIVRKRLASGEIRVYTYAAQPAPPPPAAPEAIFAKLIRLYRQSPEWDRLAPGTKRRKHRYFRRMVDAFGWMLKEDVEDKAAKADFTAFRNSMQATPTESDLTMDCLTALLNWAVEEAGELDINRARKIKRLSKSGPRRAHLTWSSAQIAAIEAQFPPTLVWAFKLALYTAARQGDLCALRWDDLGGNSQVLRFMPSKTSRSSEARIALPTLEFAPLRGLLAEIPRLGPTILTTLTGRPWTAGNLRRAWTTALNGSSLAGCGPHLHDLRETSVRWPLPLVPPPSRSAPSRGIPPRRRADSAPIWTRERTSPRPATGGCKSVFSQRRNLSAGQLPDNRRQLGS
jgi:integrase